MNISKKLKIAASCLLAGVMMASVAGCGGRDAGEERDENRIQIECVIADVGMGNEWLYSLKSRFEKDYPKAQIMINVVTSDLNSDSLKSTMSKGIYDVVIPNEVDNYDELKPYLKDVTYLMTKKAYDSKGNYVKEGGTVSIEDRIKTYERYYDSVNLGTEESPVYLSMPYYLTPYGCWYDYDLFEEEGFFELEYEGIDGVKGTEDDTWGADGIEGTYDDNLPATFDDYKMLINELYQSGITPFTWSGVHTWMRTFYLDAVNMSYEGAYDYGLNYTLNGTDSQFGEITKENGYQLIDQDGRKAALAMAEFMTSVEGYYSEKAFKNSQTHLEAQRDFLGSVVRTDSNRIAMLLDGAWWENEAKSYMNSMAAERGEKYAHGNRRFGFMPVPFFEEDESIGLARQQEAKTVLRAGKASNFFISNRVDNASEEKQKLVEEFLLYAQSYESVKDFTKITGVIRPVESYFTESDLDSFTFLAKQMYEVINTAELFMMSDEMNENYSQYKTFMTGWFLSSKVGNSIYNDPMITFAENKCSFQEYYNGLKNYTPESTYNTVVLGR